MTATIMQSQFKRAPLLRKRRQHSVIKTEVHHVTIGDDVFLAL